MEVHVSPRDSGKLHLRRSQIQFFFLGKGNNWDSPSNSRVYGARERSPVNPVFRLGPTPTLKHLAPSLVYAVLPCVN